MKRCHGRLHYNRKFQIFIFLMEYTNVNKGVFCLIISYLRIKSYNVLNYNNCSTDWSFPLRVFSNRCPFQILRSMVDLLVRVRAYISDVIGRLFEKWEMAMDLRIGRRFEKLKKDIDLRFGRLFENLKKGHIFEVQMSVTSIWVLHIYTHIFF